MRVELAKIITSKLHMFVLSRVLGSEERSKEINFLLCCLEFLVTKNDISLALSLSKSYINPP